MAKTSIVTLLTDFGIEDVYVGTMKGAIARVNPQLQVIDLTHNIPPQQLDAARFCLMNAYAYFPDDTVHIAVVDPGVGSSRRSIAVSFSGGFLVGPDNGLFSGVLSLSAPIAAVELNNPRFWRTNNPSNTFHGRDIFAPVGAHLASGVPLKELGKSISLDSLVTLPIPDLIESESKIIGCIQYIDRFGNLITNIPAAKVEAKTWKAIANNRIIESKTTYSDVAKGEIVTLIGSHGWVEIAVNQGNAREVLQVDYGTEITIVFD